MGLVTHTATITLTSYGTAPVTNLVSTTISPSQTSTQSQTISSSIFGGVSESGISTGEVKSATFADQLMNGGISAGIGLLLTVAILYFIAMRRRKLELKLTPTTPSSFSVINPLTKKGRQGQRPQAPLSKPPKFAMKSYAATVKE